MSFCKENVKFPYFTITRVFRDNNPVHYAFVGNHDVASLSNKTLLDIFGKQCTNLWTSIHKKKEKLHYINDRIWLDDTVFKIKNKIFIYMSSIDWHILPENQQVWITLDGTNTILGYEYEKNEKAIVFQPTFYDTPGIDDDFITDDFDRHTDLIPANNEYNILYDEIKNKEHNTQIFLYTLNDELSWINDNNIVLKENEKKLWNGYILKHWPFSKKGKAKDINVYNEVKKDVAQTQKTLELFREKKHEGEPKLDSCILYKIHIQVRPPEKKSLPLDLIYIYLRTLLSKEIPFIYYHSPITDKKKISVYKKFIDNGISAEKLKLWTDKKGNGIIIQILQYQNQNGDMYFINCKLAKDGNIIIYLSFDETFKGGIQDLEDSIDKISSLIEKINKKFLEPQKLQTLTVPYLKYTDNDFVSKNYTNLQYFSVIIGFTTTKILNLSKFVNYVDKYKSIANISLVDRDIENQIVIKYNRISDFPEIPKIFEYIEESVEEDRDKDDVLKSIVEIFGKTYTQASDLYNQYTIYTYDKESSKKTIPQYGTSIHLKKYADFVINKKYRYKFEIQGLKSFFILRNCYAYLQTIMVMFLKDFTSYKNSNFSLSNNNFNLDNNIENNVVKKQEEIITEENEEELFGLKYKLQRLQKYEQKIFRFKPSGKERSYPRHCPQGMRPVIMKNNPEDDTNIDRDSFTYSIKYKSSEGSDEYYYICPEAWCPTCEKPILKDNVTNIKKIKTKDGLFYYGQCPNGKHKVILIDPSKKTIYPGFQDASGNPYNLCMPCCFLKNRKNHHTTKKCISSVDESNAKSGYIYRKGILKLKDNTFGFLPDSIREILNQEECKSQFITNKFECFLRKGISNDESNSFTLAICDIMSGLLNKKITEDLFRIFLIEKLNNNLFNSLNSGFVKRKFKTIDNYKKYLKDSPHIFYLYIWDFITRPGIILDTGFNVIILTLNTIECPYGQNLNMFYKKNRPSALFMKYSNIYQPIYLVTYTNKIIIKYLQPSSKNIDDIINVIQKKCSAYDEINWNKVAQHKYSTEIITFDKVIDMIGTKLKIKNQLLDKYAKVSGLILSNDLYIPIEPTALNIKYPFKEIVSNKDIPLLSLDKALNFLNQLKIKILKLLKVNDKIIGVLLATNRIIPVVPIKINKKYKESVDTNTYYYPEVNSLNYDKYRERVLKINEFLYTNEAYERYLYEISTFLQTKQGFVFKANLSEELDKDDPSTQNIKNILNKLNNILLASEQESKKKIEEIIKSNVIYNSKLIRTPCFSSSNADDKHCICKKNNCKLLTIVNSNFVDKFINLLLNYPIQREEIINGTMLIFDIDTVMNKTLNGELLMTENTMEKEFEKLLAKNTNGLNVDYYDDIDFIQPTFEGIDKKAYLKINTEKQKEYRTYLITELSTQWTELKKTTFKLISSNNPCDSLPFLFFQILNYVNNNDVKYGSKFDTKGYTKENFIEKYSKYLLDINESDIKKIANAYLTDIKNIDKMVDISDFYNLYHKTDSVNTVDELINKIQLGYPVYQYSLFDLVMISNLLNINVMLLKKTTCELFGNKLNTNDLYAVFFTSQDEKCLRFYMVYDDNKPYVSNSGRIRKIISKCT